MINIKNAQEWLDEAITQDERKLITNILPEGFEPGDHDKLEENGVLYVPGDLLEGELDLSDFANVKTIHIEGHLITKLNLTGCQRLEILKADNNQLREVIWPRYDDDQVSPLTNINLTNNDFPVRDLSEFEEFINLIDLSLGTEDRVRISQNIYNRWSGSLFHLRKLEKLFSLNINGTDINSGVEHLTAETLSSFVFGNSGRDNAGVKNIQIDLAQNLGLGIEGNELNNWASDKGKKYDDVDAAYEKAGDIRDWAKKQQKRARLEQVRQALSARIETNNSRR